MADNIILLLLAAYPLMGSPGPATLSLTAMGSAFGVPASLRYLAGIVIGTTAVLLIIAAGVGTLVLALPGVAPVLAALGCAYVLYLAYRIATAPVLADPAAQRTPPSFLGGLLLAIANPKAYAAIGAVYAGITVVAERPGLDAAVKVAALSVVIATVNPAWLVAGATFARLLRKPRAGRIANIVFAVLLVAAVGASLLA